MGMQLTFADPAEIKDERFVFHLVVNSVNAATRTNKIHQTTSCLMQYLTL